MKKSILVLLSLLSCVALSAQDRAPVSVVAQPPIRVAPQRPVKLPQGLHNLSVVDGRLYASVNDVMLCTPLAKNFLSSFLPDTHFVNMGSHFDYLVRNPRDGFLYFSHKEGNSPYSLFVHQKERGKRNVQVPIRAWFKDICHPAFSPDGNMIVFSAKGKIGLGGYDLWCTIWNGKKWSKPVNLGNVINTQGNEIHPVFYHNYLIFASDGVDSSQGYQFYSVRLREGAKVNDIILDNYVVQPLPSPINSCGDNVDLAFDLASNRGFWLSNRSGKVELYSFVGDLECVMIRGIVSDEFKRPLSGAAVQVLRQGRLVNAATTDSLGRYQLLILPDDDYLLSVQKDNFYTYRKEIAVIRPNEDLLIASAVHNVVLPALPFDRPLIFDNGYRQGVDVELSPEGVGALSPVIEFVRDNPHTSLTFIVHCYQTTDDDFNNMIIEHRISSLRKYLASVLPPDSPISFKNGNSEGGIDPEQMGRNTFFVVLGNAR